MAIKFFRPLTIERETPTAWSKTAGFTLPQAVDLVDETPTHDDDASTASRGSGGVSAEFGCSPDPDFPERMASVDEVRANCRVKQTSSDTVRLFVTLGGTTVYSGTIVVGTSYQDIVFDATSLRPGGGSWAEADARDPTFGFGFERVFNGPGCFVTSLYSRWKFVPVGSKVDPWRDAASRDLFFRRFVPEVYSLEVPSYWLALEILDAMNVSHDSLPRAASMLKNIDQQLLLETWKRLRAVPARVLIPDLGDPNGNITLDFLDTEHYDCIARSTDKLPFSITNRLDGLAQMDVGASHKFSRDGAAWMQQADGRYIAVSPSQIKMNHLGILLDDARTQIAKNSNFQDGVSAIWTSFGNGTVANETTEVVFDDTDAYPNSAKITMGTTDTGVQQASMSVLAADVRRTLTFVYRDESGRSVASLQRASDAKWWDETLQSWEVAKKLNLLPNTNGEWVRGISTPIVSDVDTTWTIQFFKDTTNSLQNDVSYLAQFDNVEGRYAVAPLITDQNATFTSDREEHSLELDLEVTDTFRQMWDPLRAEHRVTYLEENEATRMADGDKRAVLVGRFGKKKDWAKVWQVDATGPTFVDITTDTNDAGASDASPFPATEAIGDYVAFGLGVKFNKLSIDVGTVGVDGTVAWEYWNGSAWAALATVVDGTVAFTVSGEKEVTFDFPSDWATTSLNGSTQFYVRARVTGTYSTNPVMTQAQAMDFADDYDAGYYEKPAGGNARFVLERVRAGVSEAKATKEVNTVRGTSYELAFRITDTDELGLPVLTLRVSVDGVNGTDAQASGQHSTTELHTELWLGSAPAALEMLNAMAFLSDRETLRTVHADEQILAMR